MATTPKGNFMAFQPLKPTEYKVGDIYSNMIDGMIKRGEAKKAAELKAAQERQKYIGDRFDKVKIDPFATTSQLTDAAMDMFKQTYEYVADQRMKAENDPSNAMGYLSNAEKAQNSYLSWAKTLGDAKFIENATKKSNEIASGQYFLDSDETDQWDLFNKGQYKPTLENGEWKVAVPKNRYATDEDPLKKLTIGEYINLNTVLPPKDLTKDLDKNIKDISAKFADEWSKNTDGNRTTGWKGYADKRGQEWFDNTYGGYDANFVPTELQQFSKRTLKKEIENEADYNEVKTTLLNQLSSYVPLETKTDTRLTPAQQEGQRLSNQQKKKDLQPKVEDPLNGGTLTSGNVILNIKGKDGVTYNTRTQGISYFVKGNTNDGKTPKVGVTVYWNPNGGEQGKGGFSYAMNFPSKDGKEVVAEGVTGNRAIEILSSNGVKKPENIVALMNMQAQNSGFQNNNPEPFGKNFQNYNINFSTVNSDSKKSEPQKKSLADKVRYKKP